MAIPTHYECKNCGARGVKLWREYQISQPTLLCRKCSEIEQKDSRSVFQREQNNDQIAWRVPAVPDMVPVGKDWKLPDGYAFWGYTSVPVLSMQWWEGLDGDRYFKSPKLESSLWGQIRNWSEATFGSGKRTIGLIEHIREELKEVEEKPEDLIEWVDVILLAFDGYWRNGGKPEELMSVVEKKFKENQNRKWLPPAPDDQPNFHVKTKKE